jgi:hypothetical protein
MKYAELLMDEEGAIDYESEGRIQIEIGDETPPEGEVIGFTEHGLSSDNKTEHDARLGNLYTDAVRSQTEADFGVLNNSSVTGEIPPGEITDAQIESLDRFGNEVVVVETNAEALSEMILSQSNYHQGVDLQVSGLQVTLHESDDDGEERFASVELTKEDGSELADDYTFTVAYNDYMHGTSFYNLGSDIVGDDHELVWQNVVDYIRTQEGSIDYEEGERIRIVPADEDGGDTTPPVTSIEIQGEVLSTGAYIDHVTVELIAEDDRSGVARIEYRIGNEEWQTYEEPFTLTGEGDMVIEYRAVDEAGNVEDIQEVSVTVIPAVVESLRTLLREADVQPTAIRKSLLTQLYTAELYLRWLTSLTVPVATKKPNGIWREGIPR